MSRFAAINLNDLPSPDVVETLDYEEIFEALKADYIDRYPEFTATLESDPVIKLLQTAAYREVRLRARVNDGARAVMLPKAVDADLEHLGAFYPVSRQVIDIETGETESDADYRRRIHTAPEALAGAGPEGAYVHHALSADPDVADADAYKPEAGKVHVFILSRSNGGEPSDGLLSVVFNHLTRDDIAPFTDQISVLPATRSEFAVHVRLELGLGPDPSVIRAECEAALNALLVLRQRIGARITISELIKAAHVGGVQKVTVLSPATDIEPGPGGVAISTGVTVETEVIE